MNNNTSEGYLRIRVTTTGNTLPLEGANVIISEYSPDNTNDTVLYSLRTDRGGLTDTVALPAPASSDSMRPGFVQPYSLYNISVTYDGYYPVEGVGVPIFAGITAVQPVNLLPLGEEESIAGAQGGRVMIYETPRQQNLTPGGVTREDVGNENGSISGGVRQSEVRE